MRIKIELYWQILIAMFLAVLFGIIFPTKYKFTYDSFETFYSKAKKIGVSDSQLMKIEFMRDKDPMTETEFFDEISYVSTFELNNTNKQLISESAKYNPTLNYISWMGIIFLRALKMIVIPLILSSIISGIANIGSGGNFGRLGIKTLVYYMVSSALAISVGIFFVNLIKPGVGVDIGLSQKVDGIDLSDKPFSETLINIIPENVFKALVEKDMLAVIFFALLFGFFITRITGKNKEFLTNFFNSSFEVMMKVTMFIIKFTPFGIFGLITVIVADKAGDPEKLVNLINSLGKYSFVVILGLAFHSLIVLPMLVKFVGKSNPFKQFRAMRAALLTAFSTSSSAATLSLTMSSVQKNCGVSTKVSGFTLPLGATVNMDGTALYECVAVFFIAQAYGVDMTISNQIIVAATALLASVGAAGIPMAGFVMISVILSAVGLEPEAVGLILTVDRILDMFRTSVNVWSDSCGAVIIAKSEGENLLV